MDTRHRIASALTLWLAACGGTQVEGRIVDGMTGQPVGGFKLVAKATDPDASITCQFKEAEVADDGTFQLEDLCGGAYGLEPDRDDVWLAEVHEVPDGGFGGPTELKAWRAPKGSGLYKLSGGELEPLKTVADVKRERIKGTEDVKVRYPSTIPNKIARIGPEDHLLLVGAGTAKDTRIIPLIGSGERVFGDAETNVRMQPWSYVGFEFEDDTTYREVEVRIDTSTILDKERDARVARWIPGSAVAEGRYALLKDDDRRMYILDFGTSQVGPGVGAAGGDAAEKGKARR